MSRKKKDLVDFNNPDSEYVARGAIANVLAKARATLKNPSRPFTPAESRQSSRALFGGLDQRPSTRPGSNLSANSGSFSARSVPESQSQESTPLSRRRRQSTKNVGPAYDPSSCPRSSARGKDGRPPPAETWGWGNNSAEQTPRSPRRFLASTGTSEDEGSYGSGPEPWDTKYDRDFGPDFAEMDEVLQIMDVQLAALFSSEIVDESQEFHEAKEEGRTQQFLVLRNLLVRLLAQLDGLCSARVARPKDYQVQRQYCRIFHTLNRMVRSHDAFTQLSAARAGIKLVTATPNFSHPPDQPDQEDNPPKYLFYITKSIYQISRTLENDDLFIESKIIDSILDLLKKTNIEMRNSLEHEECYGGTETKGLIGRKSGMGTILSCLVYSLGCLKNISSSEKIQSVLCGNEAVPILQETLCQTAALYLALSVEPKSENGERSLKLLIQATGLLRNLCQQKAHIKHFSNTSFFSSLTSLLEGPLSEHLELALNVSRVISKLSLHDMARKELYKDPVHMNNLVSALDQEEDKLDLRKNEVSALVVRIAFALGNFTATNDNNRKLIGLQFRAVDIVMSLFSRFGEHYIYNLGRGHNSGGEEGVADALVKLARLASNLAINIEVGQAIARHEGSAVVPPLLQSCLQFPADDSEEGLVREELLLNVVSLIANLAYYGEAKTAQGRSQIFEKRFVIIKELTQVLFNENEEAVSEATRTFGNLSRDPEARKRMKEVKANDALALLLDHSNREVVYSAAGVLMNLASDHSMKECLGYSSSDEMSDYGAGRLVKILRRAGLQDIEMSTATCQALYNLIVGCSQDDLNQLMYEDDQSLLIDTLEELIDTAKESIDEDNTSKGEVSYADFLSAAGALFEVLKTITETYYERQAGFNNPACMYEELAAERKS